MNIFKRIQKQQPATTQHKPPHISLAEPVHVANLAPKFTVPAIPHPCPHHSLALLVTRQGLLIRPVIDDVEEPSSCARVLWGKNVEVEEIGNELNNEKLDWKGAAVVYGILGFVKLFTDSYMLVITARSDIGDFLSPAYSVYGVKHVVAIPLNESAALTVVNSIATRYGPLEQRMHHSSTEDAISENPDDMSGEGPSKPKVSFAEEEDVKVMTPRAQTSFEPSSPPRSPTSSGTSTPTSESESTPVAAALPNRLSFWNKFTKRQSPVTSTSAATSDETLASNDAEDTQEIVQEILDSHAADATATVEERHSELEDKIVKECVREFTKGGMYFAYNFDITTSLQHKQQRLIDLKHSPKSPRSKPTRARSISENDDTDILAEPNPTSPLWQRVAKQFWWNEWMQQPLIDAGLDSYVLPVMQGFYQIATFPVPREPEETESGDNASVDYIIVSRRSRDRAGLRYQRRGIDDDANVANFVETETVMRVEREGSPNIFSFIQIRGSIPLYWTQSGYSLKPPPVLSPERTVAQNVDAIRRHFVKTVSKYGPHTIVNLAEQQGREGAITKAYKEFACGLNSKDIFYMEYDFHTETRGMKYENISKLISNLEKTFEGQGFFWVSGRSTLSEQKGVFRVNCIDCLDRTNVVQSAFARHVLLRQLRAVALTSEVGRTELDVVFNDLWANNGDAISRAYAGTSALKGDFTRTGKRDLGGMLNDGMNSLARMYSSTFSDWFAQAVIDFILGYRTVSVFSEFLLKMQSTDPRERIRLSKIRAEAIATSVARVLSEGERLLSGWTLVSPVDIGVKVGDKFEEKVLLVTARALYIISYDYNLEKVARYTRVPLADVVTITKGAYILSPLEEGSRDPEQNYGFMISYLTSGQTTRVTSYSLRNSADMPRPSAANATGESSQTNLPNTTSPVSATLRRSTSLLSRVLSAASLPPNSQNSRTFVAFKALPIDPARSRRGTGSFEETAGDDLAGARSCREAVGVMVEAIKRACVDIGGGGRDGNGEEFVREVDIVSLAESQRMTSVYAKMEYGIKRLLWLGG